ncbi:MAG: anti-sigma factor family protein [Solirubrobacterales bacterium]|jgi:anti-sigma factor RsiW
MISCREAEDLVERRLDGERTADSEHDLTEHLAGCQACSRLLEQEAAVDAALTAHFADREPTAQFGRRVLSRLAQDPIERLGWIADALNAVGAVALAALAIWALGQSNPATVAGLLGILGSALAVGLYPLVLARCGGEEPWNP